MEDFNTTNTSQGFTIHIPYDYRADWFIPDVITYIIIPISFPVMFVAIYALYSLVRKDHVAPIYVINLLISDLIQLCFLIVFALRHDIPRKTYTTAALFYDASLISSVSFMVCVALERYLVIACPLWYRFRRTMKISLLVCAVVWALYFVFIIFDLWLNKTVYVHLYNAYLLLPLPLFIFFLCGTLKALSATHVSTEEKRRIVGLLIMVLLIYMLLFLPTIWLMIEMSNRGTVTKVAFSLLQLSPLADSFLYILMKKGTIDKLLASFCCCRMDSNDSSRCSTDISTSTV